MNFPPNAIPTNYPFDKSMLRENFSSITPKSDYDNPWDGMWSIERYNNQAMWSVEPCPNYFPASIRKSNEERLIEELRSKRIEEQNKQYAQQVAAEKLLDDAKKQAQQILETAKKEAERVIEKNVEPEKNAQNDKSCVICMDRERNILCLPCRHVAICQKCSVDIVTCPSCRAHIVQKIDFFTP